MFFVSTRAAIAVPHGDGWIGVYHHFDGYPSELGAYLHKIHTSVFAGDTAKMIKVLTEDHQAWSSIEGDWSLPIGYGGSGPNCYCHGERSEQMEKFICTCPSPDSDCDPLHLEWAYVLSKAGMATYESKNLTVHQMINFTRWEDEYILKEEE